MKKTVYLFFLLTLMFGCKTTSVNKEAKDKTNQSDGQEKEVAGITLKSGTITLTEAKSLPFLDAKLKINQPLNGGVAEKIAKFDFGVENFVLGNQTPGESANHCANSAKGQHIHLILNNSPYTAHYESSFTQELQDGQYVGLAFLSRSYHESLKTKDAYQLFNFSVGKTATENNFKTEAPHMFYSRPKGTYKGMDTHKVLLDFYLINVNLSKNGYKVKATINGASFLLTKWVPFVIEGLPMGENTIELTLIDAKGKIVDSPFNPVTRTITLEE